MRSNPRVDELVAELRLRPHPEGGSFRETFRSPHQVHPADGRGARSALTAIYFLVAAGECSRWHTVGSDEVWQFCEGGPLELLWLHPDRSRCERVLLGPIGNDSQWQAVVPAGCWQAARPLGDYTLVACTVGPGFEFDDFTLMRDRPAEAADVGKRFPEYATLV